MNRLRARLGGLTTTHKDSLAPIARPDRVQFFPTRSSLAYLLGVGALLLPIAGFGQSLNDAVTAQLEIRNFVPCAQLRAGQPNPDSYLTGQLLAICIRVGGGAGTTPAVSTGGGAATPTTLPSIVQQRIREAHGEEKKAEATPKSGGASADRVVKLGSGLSLFFSGESDSLSRDVTTLRSTPPSRIALLDTQHNPRVPQRSGAQVASLDPTTGWAAPQ